MKLAQDNAQWLTWLLAVLPWKWLVGWLAGYPQILGIYVEVTLCFSQVTTELRGCNSERKFVLHIGL
jgi:hypothetical protein